MRAPNVSPPSAPIDRRTVIAAYAELVLVGTSRPTLGWKHHAACTGDERFYGNTPDTHEDVEHQRDTCSSCPVAHDCLIEAIQYENLDPVSRALTRGGLLATERADLARRRPSPGRRQRRGARRRAPMITSP